MSSTNTLVEFPLNLPQNNVVVDYWNERAETYSNGVWDELRGAQVEAWASLLREKLEFAFAPENSEAPRALDLGCGPGFFSILLSNMGFSVQAVDSSDQMLRQAYENVCAAGDPTKVDFLCGDVTSLPLPSETYDVIVLRNVTWLMAEPLKAYSEWKRLLKPGGKLLVFDANWYSYLADDSLNRQRLIDQEDSSVLCWSDNAFASAKQERRCEAIAATLPLTYEIRPAWDTNALAQLGFSSVEADETIYKTLWTEGEQEFYATSPLFAIEAVK